MTNQTEKIKLHDKYFLPFISEQKIFEANKVLAQKINSDYVHLNPLFVGVLNGCFMFVSDLLKLIEIPCEVTFVKVSSYAGTVSTGEVKPILGFNEELKNRHIIILEDIVDTGHTIDHFFNFLKTSDCASVKVAAFLFKPKAYKGKFTIDYKGIEVGNDFLVGYGLDYDGLGRNLKEIYKIAEG